MFPSYGDFVASQGYAPSDPSIVDRGGNSIWRISKNGNYCRFIDERDIRVTVCQSKRTGEIGYAWNIGNKNGWTGPFDTVDDAMDHADANVFGG